MVLAGVIAEWNPFHRGHRFLLEEARRRGATHIVAVMSGNYVQRGEPALCPKCYRTAAALQNGADLVVELPLPYAVATAERFAAGSVALLDALGCVDRLLFGSEAGSLAPLKAAAEVLESPAFSAALKIGLDSGITFAAARQQAVAALAGEETAAVLREPNNILGIEYLRALRQLGSRIEPDTLCRMGTGHHAEEAVGSIAPATLLRQEFRAGRPIDAYLPDAMGEELARAVKAGCCADLALWERPLMAKLRTLSEVDFASLPDCSEGLEHRLYRAARTAESSVEFLALVKTKRYTLTRLRRILLAAWLDLPGDYRLFPPPYLRILGMNERGEDILAAAKETARLPIGTSLAALARTGETAERFARLEADATDRYHVITPVIHPCGEDYTQPLVKVNLLR